MTKLEEILTEILEKDLKEGPLNIAKYGSNCFRAGALWLLEQAKKREYVVKSIDTDGAPCEIDGLTRISYLEELCRSEKE